MFRLLLGQRRNDGTFEIQGLLPGTYQLRTQTWSDNQGAYDWSEGKLDDIQVVASTEPKKVIIYLKKGEVVLPTIDLSDIIANVGATTYFYDGFDGKSDNVSVMGIIGVSQGTKLTADSIKKVLQQDREVLIMYVPMIDQFGVTWGWGWFGQRAAIGTYDFYMVAIRNYKGADGPDPGRPHMNTVFLGEVKDKTIMKGATNYITFQKPSFGDATIKGTITGQKIFTQDDMSIIKNDFSKFLGLVPTAILYDSNGKLAAFSMEVPAPAYSSQYGMAASDGDLNALKNLIADSASKPEYHIPYLKAGTYRLVAYSPNYPPYVKQITLSAGETKIENINLDSALGSNAQGATLTGTVSTQGGGVIAGASILLKNHGTEKTATTDSDGVYSFDSLPLGLYYMAVSASDHALQAAKVGIPEPTTITKDIELPAGTESITGTVYVNRFTGQTYEGAKIVMFLDEELSGESHALLSAYVGTSDENGDYEINGLVSGKYYKLFVIVPGKKVEALKGLLAGTVSSVDFTLKNMLPELGIKYRVNGSNVEFKIFSLKTLVGDPTVKYMKGDRDAYVDGSASAVTLTQVTTTSDTWTCSITPGDSDVYTLKATANDGSDTVDKYIEFSLNKPAKVKVLLNDILAEGGDVSIDESGSDPSTLSVPVGGIESSGSGASSLSDSGFTAYTIDGNEYTTMAIGGLSSALLEFSKTVASAVGGMISDEYEVSIEEASIEKDLLLTIQYDSTANELDEFVSIDCDIILTLAPTASFSIMFFSCI